MQLNCTKYLLINQTICDYNKVKTYSKNIDKNISFDYNIAPKNNGDITPLEYSESSNDIIYKLIYEHIEYEPYNNIIDKNTYACVAARNKIYIDLNCNVNPCV